MLAGCCEHENGATWIRYCGCPSSEFEEALPHRIPRPLAHSPKPAFLTPCCPGLHIGVFPKIIGLMSGSEEAIKRECTYVLANPWASTVSVSHEVAKGLLDAGLVAELTKLLEVATPLSILIVAMDGLQDAIKRGQAMRMAIAKTLPPRAEGERALIWCAHRLLRLFSCSRSPIPGSPRLRFKKHCIHHAHDLTRLCGVLHTVCHLVWLKA